MASASPWSTGVWGSLRSRCSAKAITAFSLEGVAGAIHELDDTIAVTLPFGTDVTALVATFTTTGTGVAVGSTPQTSGTNANDFSSPVTYTVTAADGTTADYSVTVTVADSPASITSSISWSSIVNEWVVPLSFSTSTVTSPAVPLRKVFLK